MPSDLVTLDPLLSIGVRSSGALEPRMLMASQLSSHESFRFGREARSVTLPSAGRASASSVSWY